MKKLIQSLFFSALLWSILPSASAQKNWEIGALAGAAIPLGAYQHYNSQALGQAATGIVAGLEINYNLHQYLGLALSLNHYLNPIDADHFAESIWNEHKTAASVTITGTPYQVSNLSMGIRPKAGLIPNKLAVFAGLSAGLTLVRTPTLTQEIQLSSPLHQTIQGASSTAFSVQGQAGIELYLSSKLGLHLFGEYLSSKPSFDFLRSDQSGSPTESSAQRIQIASVGLKLAYALQTPQHTLVSGKK